MAPKQRLMPVRATRQNEVSANPFRVIGLQWRAWYTERTATAELRVLAAREKLLDGRSALGEKMLSARERLASAAVRAEDALAELDFHRRRRLIPPQQAHRGLTDEVLVERLLLERELIRKHRALGTPAKDLAQLREDTEAANRITPGLLGNQSTAQPASDSTDSFALHVSDEQIESLALRAAARFSQLRGKEAERAWSAWRSELYKRFAEFTALEIEQRVLALRRRMT